MKAKKLSTIPADLPAVILPLQDKSNKSIGSDVMLGGNILKDRAKVNQSQYKELQKLILERVNKMC